MRIMPLLVPGIAGLTLAACAGKAGTKTAATEELPAQVDCGIDIAGLPDVAAANSLILIGEVHGTNEVPRAVGDMACQIAASGRRVVVAIEHEVGDQAVLDEAVERGDRQALIAGAAWTRAYQDGRTSAAMADLIMRVHAMHSAGLDVSVAAFSTQSRTREADMAANLRDIAAANAEGTVLALTGNLHARTVPGTPMDPAFKTAGSYLIQDIPAYAINAVATDGSWWVCTSDSANDCGVHEGGDPTRTSPATIRPRPERTDGYDAELDLGALTASPPATAAGAGQVRTAAP